MTEKLSERVTNPAWPNGQTVREVLGMWEELGHCRWCDRQQGGQSPMHDGYCPIPFLEAMADAGDALEQQVEEYERVFDWQGIESWAKTQTKQWLEADGAEKRTIFAGQKLADKIMAGLEALASQEEE